MSEKLKESRNVLPAPAYKTGTMLAQINKTFAWYLHVSVPVAVLLK